MHVHLLSLIGVAWGLNAGVVESSEGAPVTLKYIAELSSKLRSSEPTNRDSAIGFCDKHKDEIREYCAALLTLGCGSESVSKPVHRSLDDLFEAFEGLSSGPAVDCDKLVLHMLASMQPTLRDASSPSGCCVTTDSILSDYAHSVLTSVAERTPERVAAMMEETDPQVVYAALDAFIEVKEQTPDQLSWLVEKCRNLIHSEDEDLRSLGILGLSRLQGAKATDEILALFDDKSPQVRGFAIGWIQIDERRLALIAKTMRALPRNRRLSLLEALSWRGGNWDTIFLANIEDPDDEVRALAVEMAAVNEFDNIPLKVWASLLHSPNPRARRVGVENLPRIRDPHASSLIESYINDKDPSVQAAALESLSATGSSKLEEAAEQVLGSKMNEDLIRALCRIIELKDSVSKGITTKMMQNRSAEVRVGALSAYARLLHHKPPDDFMFDLFRTAFRDSSDEVRARAALLLRISPMMELSSLIVEGLTNKSMEARALSLSALAALPVPEATAELIRQMHSSNPQTAELAYAAKLGAERMQWFEAMAKRYEGAESTRSGPPPW